MQSHKIILYCISFLISFRLWADDKPILPPKFTALYNISDSLIAKGEYDKGFDFLNQIKYAPETPYNEQLQAAAILLEGEIYRQLQIWDKAETLFLKSGDLFKKTNQKEMAYYVTFNLASIVESSHKYPEKIYQYSKNALELALELNDSLKIARCYDAIGCAFFALKQYDQAVEYSKKAESTMCKMLNYNVCANIAEAYLAQGDYNNAAVFIDKVIRYYGDNSTKGWINNAYRIAGTIYLKLGRTDDGIKYLTQALNFIRKNVNNPHFAKKTFDLMIEESLKKSDYKKAFDLQKEYSILKDDASKKELVLQLNRNQILLDINTKEKERELLTSTLKNERKVKKFTVGIAILLASFLITIFFLYWEKKGFNEKLKIEVLNQTETLVQKNVELERFAFIASHDLRTPLRNIISFSGLLQRRLKNSDDKDVKEYTSFIKDYAHHMNNIIDDILDFSKIGKESEEIIEAISLNDVKDTVIESLKGKIQERQASIHTEGVLPTVKVNKTHATQLLQNLVENALIYNESAHPEIWIGVETDKNGNTYMYVKDNGIGIDAQYQEKVFEMFTRLHSIEKYPGTGLGLAICKKIVVQYGGRIWINSEKEKGTTINFLIPMAA